MNAAELTLLLAVQVASPSSGGADEAIRAVEAEFAAAWAAHDPQRMARSWVEDGDFMNPFGRFARGRAALEALFREEQAGVMRTSTYKFNLDSARQIAADVVVTDWTNVIQGMVGPTGDALPPFTHHVTTVFVRRHGRWWKAAARATALLPPPPTGSAK